MGPTGHRIISRKDARAAGLTRYFTGRMCRQGHVAERKVTGAVCSECHKEYQQTPEYKARRLEYQRKPEVKARRLEYQRKPEVKDYQREYQREYQRHKKYYSKGCIPTRPAPEYCECRGCIPCKRGLYIDHDHKTGAFRGWLCHKCNTGIGLLGDGVEGLALAIEYLKRAGLSEEEDESDE